MADYIRPTPRNPLLGLIADAMMGGIDWMQDPRRTQQMRGIGGLLSETGIAQTVDRLASGEPLTKGKGFATRMKPETAAAAMTLGPEAVPIGRAAMRAVRATEGLPIGASIRQVAPREEALRLAQQRAALPVSEGGLGLPPNNTPMDRARAMGFDTPAVHFSRHGVDVSELDSGRYAVAPFDAVGTHVGSSEAALDRFKNTVGTTDQIKGSTYPIVIKRGREFLSEGAPWNEDQLSSRLRKIGGHDWSDINGGRLTYQQMNQDLRKKLFSEFDSIPYVNDVEAKGQISYIVPPQNIRSRFAAFDPTRRNETDLLAGALPFTALLDEENRALLEQQFGGLLGR